MPFQPKAAQPIRVRPCVSVAKNALPAEGCQSFHVRPCVSVAKPSMLHSDKTKKPAQRAGFRALSGTRQPVTLRLGELPPAKSGKSDQSHTQ